MVQSWEQVWNKGILIIYGARPMPNQCNYYQHEEHMIFDYPFIEEFIQQGLVNHVMNYVHNKLSLENHNIKKFCKQTWVVPCIIWAW
jgi:hypothetical protein